MLIEEKTNKPNEAPHYAAQPSVYSTSASNNTDHSACPRVRAARALGGGRVFYPHHAIHGYTWTTFS